MTDLGAIVMWVAINAAGAAAVAWFWPHCARPVLDHHRARPIGYAIGLGVTALSLVALIGGAVLMVITSNALWAFLGFFALIPWLLVVGTTIWPLTSPLVRMTAGHPVTPFDKFDRTR